jgi:hypothetical protein
MTMCIELYVSQCVEGAYWLNISSGMLNSVAVKFSKMLLLLYQKVQGMTFQKMGLRLEYFWS